MQPRIKKHVAQLEDLIQRLEVHLQKKPVVLSEFLSDVVRNFEQDHHTRGIELSTDFGWDGTLVMDQDRIERVVENVVRNAIQAIQGSNSTGKVELKTCAKQDNGMMMLSIQDNGPGIPDEVREHLFEPFFTHGKKEGTGLGLAVAARVIEEHGGKIHVGSELGKGTTFDICLPIPSSEEVVS